MSPSTSRASAQFLWRDLGFSVFHLTAPSTSPSGHSLRSISRHLRSICGTALPCPLSFVVRDGGPQPSHPAPPALFLGRGRLLHPCRAGLLPHRPTGSSLCERPPAPSQHSAGHPMAYRRLTYRGHATAGVRIRRRGTPCYLPTDAAATRPIICHHCHAAHRCVSHLVYAKLVGPCRHLCGGLHAVGI